MAAEAGRGLHEAQLVNDFVARVGRLRPEQQIAFAQAMPLRWVSKSRMVIS